MNTEFIANMSLAHYDLTSRRDRTLRRVGERLVSDIRSVAGSQIRDVELTCWLIDTHENHTTREILFWDTPFSVIR